MFNTERRFKEKGKLCERKRVLAILEEYGKTPIKISDSEVIEQFNNFKESIMDGSCLHLKNDITKKTKTNAIAVMEEEKKCPITFIYSDGKEVERIFSKSELMFVKITYGEPSKECKMCAGEMAPFEDVCKTCKSENNFRYVYYFNEKLS